MSERYPGYLYRGTPVSSWDRSIERSINLLENQIQNQFRNRPFDGRTRFWGSMSEGGGISGAGGDSNKTNLIVNYLPQTMTEKDLYAMFMTIGPVESCRVMKDFKTGYSYGFGFVNYTREEDAARAIETFNGYQLRNKRLKVSYARPSSDDIKETNLYVTNLPRAITEDQLETIFGKYGRIVQKHILRDKSNGTPRGVAFVRYDKREEAQEAIAALNNVIPEGGTEPLSVKPTCWEGVFRRSNTMDHNWRTSSSRSRLQSDNMNMEDVVFRQSNPMDHSCSWRTAGRSRHHSDPMHTDGEIVFRRSNDNDNGGDIPFRRSNTLDHSWRSSGSRSRLHSDPMVAEEHGKQKAAYYAGYAAGFHHNRGDFGWPPCGGCMMADEFTPPHIPGSHPATPRSGCRSMGCPNSRIAYPNYIPGKPATRTRGRSYPWAPTFGPETAYKGQRCRSGPSPYW